MQIKGMKFYRAQHIYPFYRPKGISSREAHLSGRAAALSRKAHLSPVGHLCCNLSD
jgi:hypothetical protein